MGNCKSSEGVLPSSEHLVASAFADFGALVSAVSNTSGGLDEVIRRIHEAETEKSLGSQPASKETIAKLPQVQVNQVKNLSANEPFCCAVCLNCCEEEAMIKQLPCGHCFHIECADEWLKRRCTCPVCRTKLGVKFNVGLQNTA